MSDAFLLTAGAAHGHEHGHNDHDHVVFEGMDSFEEKRRGVMERTRKFFHRGWGKCCGSHDNMIKQWNSIQGVWDLMRQYEDTHMNDHDHDGNDNGNGNGNGKNKHHYYEQVGLFRSDVYYTRPIDIFDSQAAVPNFAHHHGYNDRLFYGTHENAETWASKRFDFINTFEELYMYPFNHAELTVGERIRMLFGYKFKDGYHSETFVKKLMDHYGVRVKLKDHCVWRVRSGQKILVGDCDGMAGFSTFGDVKAYRPPKDAGGGSEWSMVVEG